MEHRHLTIKHLALEDRPREKLLQKGRSALSEAELIAILIGSGNKTQTAVELAQQILSRCQHDVSKLAMLSIKELEQFNGIGEAKAITIAAALELGRRRKETEPTKRPRVRSSEEAFDQVSAELLDIDHEEFWIVLLRRNNEVIKKEMVSKGGVAKTFVDNKIIFKRALEESASALILAHNHPSGSLKPSTQDIDLTNKIVLIGKALGITIFDHIIVTNHGFYSFADSGRL